VAELGREVRHARFRELLVYVVDCVEADSRGASEPRVYGAPETGEDLLLFRVRGQHLGEGGEFHVVSPVGYGEVGPVGWSVAAHVRILVVVKVFLDSAGIVEVDQGKQLFLGI
jgi:hypothetical protein